MRCRTVLTRIDALRTGELEPSETPELKSHLGTCPSCNESVDDIEQFASVVRSLATPLPLSLANTVAASVCESFDSIDVDGERVWIAFSSRGIRMIDVHSSNAEEFRQMYRARFGRDLREGSLPKRYRTEIESAIRGGSCDPCEVDLTGLTKFEQQVLQTIAKIPRGEVRPYNWVARAVRRPKAARAIGNVMANNPIPFLLPCHRVVPAGGGVGSYGMGSPRKRALLDAEGTPVEELDALARKRVLYLGSRTTKIFCFPTCRDARRIREENRIGFRDETEARQSGFRPCKRCTPAALGA